MKDSKVKLSTVGKGRAEAVFQREMTKVLENISDPAADPTKKRSITLTIELTPDKNNIPGQTFAVNTTVSGKSALAPFKAVSDTIYIDQGAEGEAQAFNSDPKEASTLDAVRAAQNEIQGVS